MFDIDDDIASFFDKTTILEDLGIPFDRVSRDNKTNNSGYWLTDLCKNNNIFIVNGRFGKDKRVGAATFRDQSGNLGNYSKLRRNSDTALRRKNMRGV